jgi:hypothetical protein
MAVVSDTRAIVAALTISAALSIAPARAVQQQDASALPRYAGSVSTSLSISTSPSGLDETRMKPA